jgi:hypothetical protein
MKGKKRISGAEALKEFLGTSAKLGDGKEKDRHQREIVEFKNP